MKIMFDNFFYKKKILITGHTGFKGSWLTFWLSILGAKIIGISLKKTKLSKILNGNKKIKNYFVNIIEKKKIEKIILKEKPDIIFHLAAQALVGNSYQDPFYTWQTNVMGMLNIMEVLKKYKKKCTIILITSDKVYKNVEQEKGYKEKDVLHGIDPYSASKSCADILAQSYINSNFYKDLNLNFGIARAGNVIGGGDFSKDRIIPDLIRSIIDKKTLIIRQPNSTRPWQNVIEVIFGYLVFSKFLYQRKKNKFEILNFGPKNIYNFSVIHVIREAKKFFNFYYEVKSKKINFKESKLLKLNSKKSKKIIKWCSILNFKETIFFTLDWYRFFLNKEKPKILRQITEKQLKIYYEKYKKKLSN